VSELTPEVRADVVTALSSRERSDLSRALLSRLADQCTALEAALTTGNEQARALRVFRPASTAAAAFEDVVERMVNRRAALEAALVELVDAANRLAGQQLPSIRAATPFLDTTFLKAWESGLARLGSLNTALAEQQLTAELHARRGLTVLDAWRNLLGAPADVGPTYNRYGQTRGHQPESPQRLDIKL
jgi:hypothetical protein